MSAFLRWLSYQLNDTELFFIPSKPESPKVPLVMQSLWYGSWQSCVLVSWLNAMITWSSNIIALNQFDNLRTPCVVSANTAILSKTQSAVRLTDPEVFSVTEFKVTDFSLVMPQHAILRISFVWLTKLYDRKTCVSRHGDQIFFVWWATGHS